MENSLESKNLNNSNEVVEDSSMTLTDQFMAMIAQGEEDGKKVIMTPEDITMGKVRRCKHYFSNKIWACPENKDWNSLEERELRSFRSAIKSTKECFLELAESTDQEIIDFLRNSKDQREEVMKGMCVEGIFCDIEGTILIDGQLNSKVVSRLKEYEQAGKQITLWTDGDLAILDQKLRKLGDTYPLKSKIEFAGAKAEVVIDDLSKDYFSAHTKISAEKFINVAEL